MKKEEQDKLWAELSEESKEKIRKEYINIFVEKEEEQAEHGKTDWWHQLTGKRKMLRGLYGEHNLKPALNYEDILKWSNGKDLTKLYKKLEAIGDLILVAKYLNKNEDGSDWVPDWMNNSEKKWYIFIDRDGDVHVDEELDGLNSRIVYFRTEELAQQAIQILGEDVVRTALTTIY